MEIAFWSGEAGDPRRGLRLAHELQPDLIRIRGYDHPDTPTNRNNIAALTRRGRQSAGSFAAVPRAADGPNPRLRP
jgi:hypothetical protein